MSSAAEPRGIHWTVQLQAQANHYHKSDDEQAFAPQLELWMCNGQTQLPLR